MVDGQAGLSLSQAPPFSVPLRFFLTAPCFAAAAGIGLVWMGPGVLVSRWSPGALLLTHLLTLGVLTMVMAGAWFQMLPVLGGRAVPRPTAVAGGVHVLLTLGTLALVAGLMGIREAYALALAALGGGLGLFVAVLGLTLWKAPAKNDTVYAMALSLAALFVTVSLGLLLAGARAGYGTSLFPGMRDVHPLWGLLGWVGLLVMGVAFQVVPMFQITRDYPLGMRRYLAAGVFLLLVAASLGLFLRFPPWFEVAVEAGLAMALALFAIATLRLLSKRRRRLADTSLRYWYLGMLSLLGCIALWLWDTSLPHPSLSLAMGILFMVGFAQSIVHAMLFKIVPFLVWFHLQGLGVRGVSSMQEVLPEAPLRWQLISHGLALGFLLGTLGWPPLGYAAGAAYGGSALLLFYNLLKGSLVYRKARCARSSSD